MKPAGPPKAFQDKWEGEDEDDDVKVSVFFRRTLSKLKTLSKIFDIFEKRSKFAISHFSFLNRELLSYFELVLN